MNFNRIIIILLIFCETFYFTYGMSDSEIWEKIPTTLCEEYACSVNISFCCKDNLLFEKAELLDGKIIIYDCLEKYADASSLPKSDFIMKTIDAFSKIQSNLVGALLLNDLRELILSDHASISHSSSVLPSSSSSADPTSGPIIIFPCEFLEKIVKAKKLQHISNLNATFFPKEILDKFPNDPNMPPCEKRRYSIFNNNARHGRCFCGKTSKSFNWPCNLIFFRLVTPSEMCVGLSAIITDTLKVGDSSCKKLMDEDHIQLKKNVPLSNDVCLFHELNHARHFLKKTNTYSYSDLFQPKNVTVNHSALLGIIKDIEGHEVLQPFGSAEEELQLIGYTIISKKGLKEDPISPILIDKIIPIMDTTNKIENNHIILRDSINEIAYRFYSNMPIRLMYSQSEIVISGKNLRILLETSLGKTYSFYMKDN